MVQARWFLVAILTLTVPMHAIAAIASELCIAFGAQGAGSTAAHDHAADKDASDAAHCPPSATALIPAAPALFAPAVPQVGIVAASVSSPDSALPRGLDRPPLAP